MKRITLGLSLWCLVTLTATAQLIDDFSDGNLLNPDWLGHTDRFAVENGELRLVDQGANTTLLYLPAATSLAAPTVYEWLIRLEFSPTSSNLARIYLSQAPLTSAATAVGYYLQVGGISGPTDALELYRQDPDGNTTLLISGTVGGVGGDPALARVRLERTPDGLWSLLADYSGGTELLPQGSASDATYDILGYFGLYYRYTTTRSDDFYFDDLRIDPLYIDAEPPQLVAASAESASIVRVTFSEPIDPASLASEHFIIDNGIGAPTAVALDGTNPTAAVLTLGTPLSALTTYRLTVDGVTDLGGNALTSATVEFTYIDERPPIAGTLIVTEFMADPSPPVTLPNTEYVELYNRSETALQLANVGIASGGSPQLLPAYILLPGEYVVITDEDDMASFDPSVPRLGVPSFPALSNGGDVIELYTPLGEELFSLRYTEAWYRDPSRSEGGYSLELTDLSGDAGCGGLWAASRSAKGGTPGRVNSVAGLVLDTDPPRLSTAFFEDNSLILRYDEQLAEPSAPFVLSPDLGVLGASLDDNGTEIIISLATTAQTGTVYELTVPASLSDCVGNDSGTARKIRLGLPEPAMPGDLIINELLFNPAVGGVDFVELFNCSQKIIDLRSHQISNEQQLSGDIRRTVGSNYLLLPGEYVAIVENEIKLRDRYTVGALLENALPTLPGDAGNVTLTSPDGAILDAVDYTDSWHSDLLDSERGVSLERIAAKGASQDANNWFSAASTVGYATPGLPNSQSRSSGATTEEFFSLRENLVSPDGDGFQDFLQIDYETSGPGWTLRWTIFNEAGQAVRIFPQTELLAGAGGLRWDGATDEGQRARSGIYVVLLQLFDPRQGERREKLVFAVVY